jgi:hypothetical protein
MNRKGKRLKGPRFYWDEDKLAQLRALLVTNATLVAIAKSFGVPVHKIVHAIKHYELIGFGGRKRGPKIHRVIKQPQVREFSAPPGWPTKAQLMAGR